MSYFATAPIIHNMVKVLCKIKAPFIVQMVRVLLPQFFQVKDSIEQINSLDGHCKLNGRLGWKMLFALK